MTGFGEAEGAFGGGRLAIEVRTVNHRHLAVQCRLPADLQRFETEVRHRLRAYVERGHASVTVRWTELPERSTSVTVNVERARAVRAALERLRESLGIEGDVDLAFVARQPDVLVYGSEEEPELEGDPLLLLIEQAAQQVVGAREREGADLAADLTSRILLMEDRLQVIEARAPERLTAERDRLRQAVTDLLNGRQLDESRLAQEIALLAERMDITEEIVRLRSHFASFRAGLAASGAVGRRLAFLGQEMLREVNTIGSKANDAAMAEAVIDLKSELEKIREQVENIE
jgi:uncharacterized protein (TIGR00255 family)